MDEKTGMMEKERKETKRNFAIPIGQRTPLEMAIARLHEAIEKDVKRDGFVYGYELGLRVAVAIIKQVKEEERTQLAVAHYEGGRLSPKSLNESRAFDLLRTRISSTAG